MGWRAQSCSERPGDLVVHAVSCGYQEVPRAPSLSQTPRPSRDLFPLSSSSGSPFSMTFLALLLARTKQITVRWLRSCREHCADREIGVVTLTDPTRLASACVRTLLAVTVSADSRRWTGHLATARNPHKPTQHMMHDEWYYGIARVQLQRFR